MTRPIIKIFETITEQNPNKDWVESGFMSDFYVIDTFLEPYLANIDERELVRISERLTKVDREELIDLPLRIVFHQSLETSLIDEQHLLELSNYYYPLNQYKYPGLFSLIRFVTIDKTFSIDRENHGFGYHFHIYNKTDRTDTLLSFDPKEIPSKFSEKDYSTFDHRLFYEKHAERNTKPMADLNSKGLDFRKKVYSECKTIILRRIEKINFKGPDKMAIVLSK